MSPPSTGLVLRIDAKVCHVEVDGTSGEVDGTSGEVVTVPLRGKLFEHEGGRVQVIAVGDRVRLDVSHGVIEEVLPRTSKLSRTRAGGEGPEKIIAANISLVLVTAAIVEPPFQQELVDRILAAAEHEGIEAVLVITKIDRDRKGKAPAFVELYESLGYRVICTSIVDGHRTDAELEEIRGRLAGSATVLSGASGVGKSAMINTLYPGLNLKVGSMSRILQGKHTTSYTRLIPLPGGGHVLDTPGIRGFGLANVDPQAVQFQFREIKPLIGQCEYRNCTHFNEPGCAVLVAVDGGSIDPVRYATYCAIVDDLTAAEAGE